MTAENLSTRPPSVQISEREMVQRMQSGDLEVFGQFFDSHVQGVYRYALARLGKPQDAEDITSTVFEKALKSLNENGFNFHGPPMVVWLMRISRNEVVSFVRRNQKQTREVVFPEDLVDEGRLDPAETVEKKLIIEEIRWAVSLLPEAQREVIFLRFAAGLSIADTSRTLKKRENNVKVLQHKGIQRLRQVLSPSII